MYCLHHFSGMRKQFIIRIYVLLFGLGMAAAVLPSQTVPSLGVFGEVKAVCAADETETEELSYTVSKKQAVKKRTAFVFGTHFSGSKSSSLAAWRYSFSRTLIFPTPVSRRVRMNP